jgi:hypothetical protein
LTHGIQLSNCKAPYAEQNRPSNENDSHSGQHFPLKVVQMAHFILFMLYTFRLFFK